MINENYVISKSRSLLAMKKIVCVLLACFCMSALFGCGNKKFSEDELTLAVREESNISNIEDLQISVAGKNIVGDKALYWFVISNPISNECVGYVPIEFLAVDNNQYEFIHTYVARERGMDIRTALWNDSYSFLVNNENCSQLKIEYHSGKVDMISVDTIPFVYGVDDSSSVSGYEFLDAEGNVLS